MKEIQLSKGYFALVDDDDYDWLSRFKWYASVKKKKCHYVMAYKNKTKNCQILSMSRKILNVTDRDVLVDHIDGNPLNNQRNNLRLCNISGNNSNVKSKPNSSSMYLGVFWSIPANKWAAQIKKHGKRYHLGVFKQESDAAIAYNIKATELHGEFANLNIIP